MTDNNKFLGNSLNCIFATTQIVNGAVVETRRKVAQINNLKLEVYSKEHVPAHFHIKSSDVDASFRIDNCELINGKISKNDIKKVQYWYQQHKDKIIDLWNETRPSDCLVGAINDR